MRSVGKMGIVALEEHHHCGAPGEFLLSTHRVELPGKVAPLLTLSSVPMVTGGNVHCSAAVGTQNKT